VSSNVSSNIEIVEILIIISIFIVTTGEERGEGEGREREDEEDEEKKCSKQESKYNKGTVILIADSH
jgi:hypothetical protein